MSSLQQTRGRYSRSGRIDALTRIGRDLEVGKVHSFRKNRESVASGGVYNIGLITTTRVLLAFRRSIVTTSPLGVIEFFSGSTYNGGNDITAAAIGDQNLRTSIPTTIQAFDDMTVTDDGTQSDEIMIRGVEGQGNNAGLGRAQVEGGFLLDTNSTYLIRTTNLDDSTHEFDFFFQWSETDPAEVGIFQ